MLAIISFAVLQYALYIVIRIVGFECWILPNFLNDNTEILKSIHPIITFTYCKDGKKEIALRIIAFLVILLIGKFLSQQAQEISDVSTRSYQEIMEWGRKALAGPDEVKTSN